MPRLAELSPEQKKLASEKVNSPDGVPIYPMGALVHYEAPKFRSLADHRHHILQRLSASIRTFSKLGFDFGFAGILCARDPEFPEAQWVNPPGLNGEDVAPEDFVLVNVNGERVAGKRSIVTAGWALLAGILNVFPEMTAVGHYHTPYGRALAAQGRMIEPISQDACMFYERHIVHDRYEGIVDFREGQMMARNLKATNGHLIILRNHGLVTVGKTVDEMAWWMIAAEGAAKSQLIAEASGPTRHLEHKAASASRNPLTAPGTAAVQFQQYYESVRRGDPALFEPVEGVAKL